MGHRMSSLPIAERCGQAPRIGIGAGRPAAMSSAFHAKCAGDDEAYRLLLARLTDDEREEIAEWLKPTTHAFGNFASDVFDYAQATKETEVSILVDGEAVTVGHPDAYLVVGSMLYVADLKRSRYTQPDPDNLQNAAYAFAIAAKHPEVTRFRLGIWDLTGGSWTWGQEWDLDDLATHALYDRVIAAARNDGDFATGPHCAGCWSRFHCPAHLLPAVLGDKHAALAPLATPGGLTTQAQALAALQFSASLTTLADKVSDAVKAWAAANGGIESGDKVWRAVMSNGRESVAVKDLREQYPDVAAKMVKRGKPYPTYRWVNK